jgi:23S rRNA (uracil1939-C5)-methyltransferase
LLDLAYADQLTYKTELVRAALLGYPELAGLELASCQAAPHALAYRMRAKWVVAERAIGLYARASHRVVDVPQCLVVDPRIAAAAAVLRTQLMLPGQLEGVDIACVGEQLLITLIASASADEAALKALSLRLGAALPALAGIAFARRSADAVQLLAAGHQLLGGSAELRHQPEPGGPFHYVAFGAFLQAHPETARAIYAELLRGSASVAPRAGAPRVLELFAGSGTLALSLAAQGFAVTAVESYAPACERLARAAREQGLAVEIEQGDAEARAQRLVAAGRSFDVVLVNPPRRGLGPKLRAAIAALGPLRVGYVSCQPSSLARDLAHFARLGLRASALTPFDMIPQTEQVESVVWLIPGPQPAAEVVATGEGWIAAIKEPHEATEENNTAAGLKARLDGACTSYRARHPLAPDSSGVVVLEQAPGRAPALEQRSFVALVKGVTRARGNVQGLRYVRERVIAGHSLLRIAAAPADDDASLRQALRRIGHPVLGDARADRASAKYFWLRHGLDRPFLHAASLTFAPAAGVPPLEAPLPADLRAVLRSVEARAQNTRADELDSQS